MYLSDKNTVVKVFPVYCPELLYSSRCMHHTCVFYQENNFTHANMPMIQSTDQIPKPVTYY